MAGDKCGYEGTACLLRLALLAYGEQEEQVEGGRPKGDQEERIWARRSGKFMPALIASRDDPPCPPRLMSKPNVHSIAFGGSQAPCKSGSFLELTPSRVRSSHFSGVSEIKVWVQLCNLYNYPWPSVSHIYGFEDMKKIG